MSQHVFQALLYGLRPTVAKTTPVDVTAVEVEQTLKGPGIYRITNLGPDIAHVRMLASGAVPNATTDDYPIAPLGSGDPSFADVLITAPHSHHSPAGPNVLHAICAAGKTATLAVTLMSRHS